MKKHFFNVIATLALVCGVFAFSGCTDFEKDINDLNNRLDALEGQMADIPTQIGNLSDLVNSLTDLPGRVKALEDAKSELEKQIADLNDRLDNAASKDDIDELLKEIADLEGRLEALEQLPDKVSGLEDLINEIKEDYLTKEEAQNTYATAEYVKSLLDSIGSINGRLELIEALDIPGIKETAEEALETANNAVALGEKALGEIEALKKALGVYAEAGALEAKIDYLEKADSALNARIDELADTLQGQINDLSDSLNNAIEDIRDVMVTKDDFNTLFNEQFALAIQSDEFNEVIQKRIDEASDALQDKIDALSSRVDALEGKMSKLESLVEDLADRIQSLVFVPEYKDGMATGYYYYIEDERPMHSRYYLSDNHRVQATFQVTPANLAETIVAQKENVFLKVLPVKNITRQQAEDIAYEVKGDNLSLEALNGRIEVDALIPVEYLEGIDAYAIALCVEDSFTENNDPESDNLDNINTGNNVSSEYVTVYINEEASDLSEKFALVKFDGATSVSSKKADLFNGANVEKAWKDADAAVTFFEGYDEALLLGDKYYTLAGAEIELRIEGALVGHVDWSYSAEYYDYDKNTTTSYDKTPASNRGVKYEEDSQKGYGVIAQMTSTDPAKVKPYIHDQLRVTNNFLYKDDNATVNTLNTYQTNYTITNKKYTLKLNADASVVNLTNWTYAVAEKYHMGPQSQDAYTFPEVLVENFDQLTDDYEDIQEIFAKDKNPNMTYTVNGSSDSYKPGELTVDIQFVAGEVARIAAVTIDGYYFRPGVDRKYEAKISYVDEDGGNEVEFIVTFTLGAMPNNQTIPLGNDYKIHFIGSDKSWTELKVNPYEYILTKSEAGAFKDADEVKQSLGRNAAMPSYNYVENTKRNGIDLAGYLWTYLRIIENDPNCKDNFDEDGKQRPAPFIRTSSSDITAFGDEFSFTTTIETWYGVTFTFVANSSIVIPSYKLEFDQAFAPNGTAKLGGINENGIYTFPTVDLSNYFQVIDAAEISDDLIVKFEPVTKVNNEDGIINLPLATVENKGVNAMGRIEETNIEWLPYTALEFQVKATLYVEVENTSTQIQVGDPLVLTIETDDPISFKGLSENLDRSFGEDLVINIWEYINVEGIDKEDAGKNLSKYYDKNVAKDWETLAELQSSPSFTKYDAELILPEENAISIKVQDGGPYTNGTFTYDKAAGTLTFSGDNAKLQNNLVIEIPVKLNHVLDRNHVNAKTSTITIILSEAK